MTMIKLTATLSLLGALVLPIFADEAPAYLEKDMRELVSMMEGRWDSDRHGFFAEDAGMDPASIAPRQHIVISPVEGAEGLKLRARRAVKDEALRELIHGFSIDTGRGLIRQTLNNPGGVLTDDPLGCDIYWARNGAGFQGTAEGPNCGAVFPRPKGLGSPNVTLNLSEDDFWISSRRGDALTEARLRRARPFSCWVAVLRGEAHGTTGEGSDDWYFTRGVLLHDQYGEAIVETDEPTPRRISLRLRNVDWPYGTNRPSLSFYVHEAGNDRALSYAWAEYDAERIGINLRWLQASCTHTPEQVFADF